MRRVYSAEIRNLRPHLRRAFLDGTRGYNDQEEYVNRDDSVRKNPGQFRDGLVKGSETMERRR